MEADKGVIGTGSILHQE